MRHFLAQSCLESRLKSAFLEPLVDLRAYLEPKLWLKNPVLTKLKKGIICPLRASFGHNWAADWARELFKPSNPSIKFNPLICVHRHALSSVLFGQVSWAGMLRTNLDYLVQIEPHAITIEVFPTRVMGRIFLRFTAKEFCQRVER